MFPGGLTAGDCATTQQDACYQSQDNLAPYSITGLTIDDGVGYDVYGGDSSDSLTLGSGGISASTSSSTYDPSELNAAIALDGSQTWSIDGGSSGEGQLNLDTDLTGTSYTLDMQVSNVGFLDLLGGEGGSATNSEVGNVTVSGSELDETGLHAYANGALELDFGAALNTIDGNPIQLVDAALFGQGAIGPVNSSGGVITAGGPTGTLTVDGPVTLNSSSALQFGIADSGTTAGTDYSQLHATGNVELSNADLDITGTDDNNDCPTVQVGATDTLIATTGSITGMFGNAPSNGDDVTLDCNATYPPIVSIHYDTGTSPNTVTATVIYTGPSVTTATNLMGQYAAGADAPITLTASVTAGSGTPSGTVQFGENGAPIGGCTSQPLNASDATCVTSLSAVGTTDTFDANFVPNNDIQEPSSSGPLQITVRAANNVIPPMLALQGVVSVDSASAKGTAAVIPWMCGGASTASCTIAASLSVTETVKSGRVIAVSAKAKATKHTVSVGTATASLAGGANGTITVALNGRGRALLKRRHSLPVKLTLSNGSSQTITFTQAKKSPPKKKG